MLAMAIARRFLANRSGTTAVEYALIVGLVITVLVGAIGALGTNLNGLFGSVVAAFPS
jgi:pilus assembly protein Flp/PilA